MRILSNARPSSFCISAIRSDSEAATLLDWEFHTQKLAVYKM
jgi:hypothetical protein